MRKRQEGIATVEAIISLTIFIFVFTAIYSIINLCLVQAKVQMALNTSAKEISQYTYFYYVFHGDDIEDSLKNNSQKAVGVLDMFNNTLAQAEETAGSVSNAVGNINEKSIEDVINNAKELNAAANELGALLNDAGSDPAAYIKSFAAFATSQAAEEAKSYLASVLAKHMSKRHFSNMDLEQMGVVKGFDGMYFGHSQLLKDGDDNVYLSVIYELQIADWLPFDLSVTINQTAKTRGWAGNK